MPSDNQTADTLNAAELAQVTATPAPAPPVSAGDIVSQIMTKLAGLEALAERVAAIEQQFSAFMPHIGQLGTLLTYADDIAGVIENLKRGRVVT